ncbi:ribonucleotide-diphosphate reductase subunit alpha, partial [Enterobacter cloacae]|nr:ribonucleotide-diphosphate reductase subunit alpha [Enterobacter cloacae]
YALAYYAFKASNKLAKSVGVFEGFEDSEYATGEYFKKYTEHEFTISSEKVKNLLKKYMLKLPTKEDWIKLAKDIKESGLANAHLLAVAPTGSISYVSSCTPSLQPVVSPIEVRKEGKLG